MHERTNDGLINLDIAIESLNRAADIMDRFAAAVPTVFRHAVNGRIRCHNSGGCTPDAWGALTPVWNALLEFGEAIYAMGILNEYGFGRKPNAVGEWADWSMTQVPASHETECKAMMRLAQAVWQWHVTERQAGSDAASPYFVSIPANTAQWARDVAEEARGLAGDLVLPQPSDPDHVSEAEALRMLGKRKIWSFDVLPVGVDLDMLRCLDVDGLIEVRACHWQAANSSSDREGPPPRVRSHLGWMSPTQTPHVYGAWDTIAGNLARDPNNLPYEIRLTDRGKAQLSRNARENWTLDTSGADARDVASGNTAGEHLHADDFSWIIWNGIKYDFTKGNQSESIRALWNSWEKGMKRDGCGLKEETIAQLVDSQSVDFRLGKVFRNHPAWGVVIRPVSKGVFALFSEESHVSPTKRPLD